MQLDRLRRFGWKSFFMQQLSLVEWDNFIPARISNIQRDRIFVETERGKQLLRVGKQDCPMSAWLAVGDWVIAEEKEDCLWLTRLLDRSSLLRRQAAGQQTREQLLAANVDTMLLVTSLNQDYNLHRLQRYIMVAHDAGLEPVAVFTKADLVDNPENWVADVGHELKLNAVAVNGLDSQDVSSKLAPWLVPGETLVLIGSSGVGKSTLINATLGQQVLDTGGIRENDAKGRHTTTGRYLLHTETGVNIIDTPGMREVQLWLEEGQLAEVFDDILQLADQCYFRNCQHGEEPGCKIQSALETGLLSLDRWQHYLKLQKEEAHHLRQAQGIAAQRQYVKTFAKMVKSSQTEKQQFKNGKVKVR
ncbi:ribosome small subunit-dependent GTPase A [Spartinivicinus poritis]|uniref:Small ribosomal subunit biogenesis GTPase RsgA n=1 Tax=Spartinivicinus poritis TaxID=2994640 RepID=A0ABT5U2X3_9GAMM|nr:ribosome small subunit-dependent GTPase A [Spartinivicinus sp. A2-2]MDE1460719.1 ribosome small subunit-dependent GTPase A [Spartinivicinus sp. A2-2]